MPDARTAVRVFNAHPRTVVRPEFIRKLARRVLRGEKRKGELNIVLVGDREIRRLNRRYLGHDRATDVVSFPLGEGERIDGEVYVSLDRARRQAREYGVDLREEIGRLVVHGILHLVGYRDDTRRRRSRMRSLENKYLTWENRSSS